MFSQSRQRELDDNLKLRQKQVEEKELTDKINSLNFKLGDLDCTKVNNERKELKNEEENLYAEVWTFYFPLSNTCRYS